eukprot:COSAG04_NODE_123_length_24709_cov_113.457294_16_plen_198_part_00
MCGGGFDDEASSPVPEPSWPSDAVAAAARASSSSSNSAAAALSFAPFVPTSNSSRRDDITPECALSAAAHGPNSDSSCSVPAAASCKASPPSCVRRLLPGSRRRHFVIVSMSPSHWSMSRLLASEMAMVTTRLRPPNTALLGASDPYESGRKCSASLSAMALTASRLTVLPPSLRPTSATRLPAPYAAMLMSAYEKS